MKKHLLNSLFLFSTFNISSLYNAHAENTSPSTEITIINKSNADISRNGRLNITGSTNTPIPSKIKSKHANNIQFSSNGVTDAGILYYGSCRFHWSTTHVSDWHFSQGAQPSSKCSAKATKEKAQTGEHIIEFTIK